MELTYGFNLADLVIVLEKEASYDFQSHYKITLKGTGELHFEDRLNKAYAQQVKANPDDVFKLFEYALEIGFFEMKINYPDGLEIGVFYGKVQIYPKVYSYEPGGSDTTSIKISTGKNTKKVKHENGVCKRLVAFEKRILKMARTCNIILPIGLNGKWGRIDEKLR